MTTVRSRASRLTLTHAFDYLPGFWSGFGGKFSYNYADSDFEFEDQHGGDGVTVSVDQGTGETTETPLIGILPPANLFGLSRHVTSTQLYWSNEKWNVEAFYKTRSEYFQQYTRDTQGRIRYTNTNQRLDLKVRYKMFDNTDVTLEAKNILDEPRIDYRGVDGNVLSGSLLWATLFPRCKGQALDNGLSGLFYAFFVG